MTPRDPLDVFLEDLRLGLKFPHRATLIETSPRSTDATQQRVFEVAKAPMPAAMLVRRTKRSLTLPVPEYRVRVLVTLPPTQIAAVARRRSDADQASLLGALDAEGRVLRSQAVIRRDTWPVLGPVVAAALMASGPSLLPGLRAIGKPAPPTPARGLSHLRFHWGVPNPLETADLEALHFDHAHSGGFLDDNGWRSAIDGSELRLSPVANAPRLGSGFLLHLRMPRETFSFGDRQVSAAELNILAHDHSEAPVFGSWSADAAGYSYRSFGATFMGWPLRFAEYYVAWGIQWAREARSLAARYPSLRA
jgi:hypothetical protein